MLTHFVTTSTTKTEIVFSKRLEEFVQSFSKLASRTATHLLITDSNVAPLYLEPLLEVLRQAGFHISTMVISSGEETKTIPWVVRICERMVSSKLTRDSHLIVLGGGVLANVSGLSASLLYRGINITLIPTTVLSQADSAIDIKHAVNTMSGKNLLGSHYPPRLVFVNTDYARTLPKREIASGLAEIIKHGLIQSAELVDRLFRAPRCVTTAFLEEDLEVLVKSAVSLKLEFLKPVKAFTVPDWKDMGPQYGHAFGHAIEHLSHFSLNHGEAISIGMVLSAELAHLLGVCGPEVLAVHKKLLARYNLPVSLPVDTDIDALISQVKLDKYADGRGVKMALPARIGAPFIAETRSGHIIPEALLRAVLESHLSGVRDQRENYAA